MAGPWEKYGSDTTTVDPSLPPEQSVAPAPSAAAAEGPWSKYGSAEAPAADKFALRPFNPGESVQNPDGSHSTEISTTIQSDDGLWTNVPTLWKDDASGQTKQFDPSDEEGIRTAAIGYEKANPGRRFPRFKELRAAEFAAKARSSAGGADAGSNTRPSVALGLDTSKLPASFDQSLLSDADRASPLPDDLIAKGKDIFADALAPKKEPMGTVEDVARSAATGLRSGAESLPGMFGDAANTQGDVGAWVARKLGASEETQAFLRKWGSRLSPFAMAPSTSDVQAATDAGIEALPGGEAVQDATRHEPQTTEGRYVRTIAEMAPSAVAGPSRFMQKAATTAASGLASETAGHMVEGSPYEGWVRAAAAVMAGGPTAFFTQERNAAGAVARAVDGATPQQIDQAEQMFNEARAAGAPVTRLEAIQQVTGGATRATDLQRVVEGQGGGRQFFAERPQHVETSGRQQLDAIGPGSQEPSTIGPAVSATAGEEITDVRQTINRVTEPYYLRSAPERLSTQEFQRVQTAPGWAEARNAVRNDPQLARYVEGLPDDSVGFLNEVQKYLGQQAENAAGPTNAARNQQRAAGYGSDARVVRGAAETRSPEFRTAVEGQAALRRQYLDPLLNGPIGKLAKEDLTTQQAIDALFPKKPLPNSEQEITRTMRTLVIRRPAVARQLIRAHIEGTFNNATKNLQSGPNQAGGAKFAAAIRADPQQAANIEAAVRTLPGGDGIWDGLNRYLTILDAQGTRQHIGSQTAFNQQLLEELKAGSAGEAVGKIAVGGLLAWPRKALDTVERWRVGKNINEIADLVTRPEMGERFRRLASTSSTRTMRNIAVSLTLVANAAATRRQRENGGGGPLEITVSQPAAEAAP